MRTPPTKNAKFKEKIKPQLSILVMTVVIISLCVSGYVTFNQYISKQNRTLTTIETAKSPSYFGYIQPQVVDGFTEDPLEGATVVIPEIRQSFVTSGDGLTAIIKIPIKEDAHYAEIAPKPWSEITLIIYKEGYIEYVLFHTHVWENQTRKGPKILLFPKVEGEENEPFSVVEGPHRIWVKELVDKFKPSN
jgi:hypothetical protein